MTDDELEFLGSTVRSLVREVTPLDGLPGVVDQGNGHDAGLWNRLCRELGLAGLLVPDEFGGVGQSMDAAKVVLHELGRGMAAVPFLMSSVVGARALVHVAVTESAGADVAAETLQAVADGVAVTTVQDPTVDATDTGVRGRRREPPRDCVLDGRTPPIMHAAHADVVIVQARLDDGPAWCLVNAGGNGVSRDERRVLDGTRPAAVLELQSVPGRVLVSGEHAVQALSDEVLRTAAMGQAFESLGASEYLLETTVQYARNRLQFGQPIGSFQAVQHKLADMAIDLDEMRSAVHILLQARESEPAEWPVATSLAAVVTKDRAVRVAEKAIQVHGGTGFTWEHPCHRFYRRALATGACFGTSVLHRERLLAASGL